MEEITIWHNPRCSKSRQTLALVEAQDYDTVVYKYLEQTPSIDMIKDVLKKLGISARDLIRTKELIYKELELKNIENEALLIKAMAEYPKLIERPIVIKGDTAVLGRPPEKVVELFA